MSNRAGKERRNWRTNNGVVVVTEGFCETGKRRRGGLAQKEEKGRKAGTDES